MQAGEIKAKITADGSGFSAELKNAKSEIKEMAQAIVNSMREIVKAETGAAEARRKAAQEAQRAAQETQKAAQQQEAAFTRLAVTAGLALAAITKALKDSISTTVEFRNAMMGLESVAKGRGQDLDKVKKAAQDLVADGLMPLSDAATGLKNLLLAGFGLEESITLMERFKDSAAFGRQGTLEFGEAVRTATEGIKNGNSILVDNAGVTKNLSVMLEEAGYSAQDLMRASDDAGIRLAIFNGILRETQHQVGDAKKLADDLGGSLSKTGTNVNYLKNALGEAVAGPLTELLKIITPIISGLTDWIEQNQKLAGTIAVITTAVVGLIAAATSLSLLLKVLKSDVIALGAALRFLVTNPIGLAITAIVGLTTAIIAYRSAQKTAVEGAQEAATASKKQAESLEALRKKYSDIEKELKKAKEGTKEHKELQEKLNQAMQEIAEIFPAAVTGYNSLGEARKINIKLLDQEIEKVRELARAQEESLEAELRAKTAKKQLKRDRLAADLDELIAEGERIRKAGIIGKNDPRYKEWEKEVASVRSELKRAVKESEDAYAAYEAFLRRRAGLDTKTTPTKTTTTTTSSGSGGGTGAGEKTAYEKAKEDFERLKFYNKWAGQKEIDQWKTLVADYANGVEEKYDSDLRLFRMQSALWDKALQDEIARIDHSAAIRKMDTAEQAEAYRQILQTFKLTEEQKLSIIRRAEMLELQAADEAEQRAKERAEREQAWVMQSLELQEEASRRKGEIEENLQHRLEQLEAERQAKREEIQKEAIELGLPKDDKQLIENLRNVDAIYDQQMEDAKKEAQDAINAISWGLAEARAAFFTESSGDPLYGLAEHLELIKDKIEALDGQDPEFLSKRYKLLTELSDKLKEWADVQITDILADQSLTAIQKTEAIQGLVNSLPSGIAKLLDQDMLAGFNDYLNASLDGLNTDSDRFIEDWNATWNEWQAEQANRGKSAYEIEKDRLDREVELRRKAAEAEIADEEKLRKALEEIDAYYTERSEQLTNEYNQRRELAQFEFGKRMAEARGESLAKFYEQEWIWAVKAAEQYKAGSEERIEADMAAWLARERYLGALEDDYRKQLGLEGELTEVVIENAKTQIEAKIAVLKASKDLTEEQKAEIEALQRLLNNLDDEVKDLTDTWRTQIVNEMLDGLGEVMGEWGEIWGEMGQYVRMLQVEIKKVGEAGEEVTKVLSNWKQVLVSMGISALVDTIAAVGRLIRGDYGAEGDRYGESDYTDFAEMKKNFEEWDRNNKRLKELQRKEDAMSAGGAAVGAGIGFLFGGWLGAGIGAAFGWWAGRELANVREEIEKLKEKLKDTFEEIKKTLGTTIGDVASGLANAFSANTYKQFVSSFATHLEDMTREALIKAFLSDELMRPMLEELSDTITYAVVNGDLSQQTIDEIKRQMEDITEAAKPFWEIMKELFPETGGPFGGVGKGRAGTQISEITGPTRDLLVSLLSPLKSLDMLKGLFESLRTAIYEMRDAFLAGITPAEYAIAGAPAGNSFVIHHLAVEAKVEQLSDLDEFMRLLSDSAQTAEKGAGA